MGMQTQLWHYLWMFFKGRTISKEHAWDSRMGEILF